MPDLSWRIGSLLFPPTAKVPGSTVHLQGGILQACTIHYHIVLTAPWSHSTRFELAHRISPFPPTAKVPEQQAGPSPRRNPASSHYPLPLIVLTAPWSHSTRFELVRRISPVRWMTKVSASTLQAGPSPRRNPASLHYPLPVLGPLPKTHGEKPTE